MRPRTIQTDEGVRRSPVRHETRCGKFAYASRKLARTVAAKVRREAGENVEAYHCYPCHAYHVGHPPGEPRTLAELAG